MIRYGPQFDQDGTISKESHTQRLRPSKRKIIEPCREITALFVLRKLVLQTRMRSHPVGLYVSFLVGPFVYFQISCVRTAMALARLRGWADSPEPSLVAYVISTVITSWTGSDDSRIHNWNYFNISTIHILGLYLYQLWRFFLSFSRYCTR